MPLQAKYGIFGNFYWTTNSIGLKRGQIDFSNKLEPETDSYGDETQAVSLCASFLYVHTSLPAAVTYVLPSSAITRPIIGSYLYLSKGRTA